MRALSGHSIILLTLIFDRNGIMLREDEDKLIAISIDAIQSIEAFFDQIRLLAGSSVELKSGSVHVVKETRKEILEALRGGENQLCQR